MSSEIHIDETQEKDWTVIRLSGRLDAITCDKAQEAMLKSISPSSPKLAVETTALDYISSAGIRSLLMAGKAASRLAGGAFAVLRPSPIVGKVLGECGLDSCLGVCMQLPE
ncbi:MAG: STAS domain-containing protein [Opitutales bacterium]|nr:STAS domain-containing protein [Opitutales bacterium]